MIRTLNMGLVTAIIFATLVTSGHSEPPAPVPAPAAPVTDKDTAEILHQRDRLLIERIRTALGELDTVVVASSRTGNDRVLRMWFAPSLDYIPVQAERTRAGKLEFAMRIKSLKR